MSPALRTSLDKIESLMKTPPVLACRSCGHGLGASILADLGLSPLANSYVRPEELDRPEPFYPLVVYVCDRCFLAQLPVHEAPAEIFTDYAYFSSFSDSWLRHAERYTAAIVERLRLGADSHVVEIASNDGYLLRFFRERGIPALGIEPAKNVADAAIAAGIPTIVDFFSVPLAQKLADTGRRADLVIGNNVLAHVPDLNGFVRATSIVLKPGGVATFEFPHLLRLMDENQFDTVYHEHFSYFSLLAVQPVFARHGLSVFDVEELPTHGGSLRVYAAPAGAARPVDARVGRLLSAEEAFGLGGRERYAAFDDQVKRTKRELLQFLIAAKTDGKTVVGYGAPAKGNTLLNYCGVRRDFIDYTVDRSPHKQGLFLPGTRIPILAPDTVRETRPDYVLILPWNLKDEIMQQMQFVREWGGRFVVPIPHVVVV
jgi:SAM-dependent methyltransferase